MAAAIALALATVSTNGQTNSTPAASTNQIVVKEGKATVKSVHGKAEYLDNNIWLPVKKNMKFSAGVTIRTGPAPECSADLSINGLTSAIRLTNNTTLLVQTMEYTGSPREGDTTTVLSLKSGTILGNVKKISANSRYEVDTPNGMMGVRGTDFMVEVAPVTNGVPKVTFSSITGLITVSAMINGQTVTHTLTSGTTWEIGQTPRQIPK